MPTKKIDFTSELAALTSDEFRLTIPLASLLAEGNTVANYFRDNYKADKKTNRPGLATAKLPATFGDEIDALVVETSAAHNAYLLSMDPKADTAKLDRARFIIEEITAVMEYYLDDGVEDDDDVRLGKVVSAHKEDPEDAAHLALALEDYAGLAEQHTADIDGLGGFDVAVLKEARKLAHDLRQTPPTAAPSPVVAAAIGRRNRFLHLLDGRIRKVRAAARFVFRADPEIVRTVMSAYERKRRINAKRAATRRKNEEKPAPAPTPSA